MSQPKRYSRIVNDCDNYDIGEDKDGDYVLYSDYAALAAEVEWLRKADRLVCWNPSTQAWEVRHEAAK